MLVIYSIVLSFVEDVATLTPRIAHHDPDLARQLRRASTSVALNCAEAMYARGRSRTACFNIALREMRESYAALEIWSHLRATLLRTPLRRPPPQTARPRDPWPRGSSPSAGRLSDR